MNTIYLNNGTNKTQTARLRKLKSHEISLYIKILRWLRNVTNGNYIKLMYKILGYKINDCVMILFYYTYCIVYVLNELYY